MYSEDTKASYKGIRLEISSLHLLCVAVSVLQLYNTMFLKAYFDHLVIP